MRLEGRRIVVTGGSRGMGRAFAQALVREGARVAVLARGSEALEATVRELGAQAIAAACDIADPQSVRDAFALVQREFGGLDVLVNNAGMSILGVTETYSDEDITRQIGVNFAGVVFACRSAIPMLRQSAEPHIVNVSSESVKQPYAMLSIYAATKCALESYSAAIRKELRDDAIRVTVLRSGCVGGTDFQSNWSDPELGKKFFELCASWGNMKETGIQPAPPEAMADALVDVLTLRRELNADLIELRPLAP